MRVKICDHQGKSANLEAALRAKGALITDKDPDALLLDWDGPNGHHQRTIEQYDKAAVLLYSHVAPVGFTWDGMYQPHSRVTAFLAQSHGEKAVMQAYGYIHPIEVIGWHYCRQMTFKPLDKINTVLFAPWHCRNSWYLEDDLADANRQAYEALLSLPYNLTVRYLYDLEASGLKYNSKVNYSEAKPSLNDALLAIDEAELIVSNPGTFACLAIARGKPVVMYGQDVIPQDHFATGSVKAQNWSQYKRVLYYSWGIDDIEQAAREEDEIWRRRFIGKPMREDYLYTTIKNIVRVG